MRIIWFECKKALTSPIIIALMLIFSAWNIFLIMDRSYLKDDLKIVNEMIRETGTAFTTESLMNIQENVQKEVSQLNEIAFAKTGRTYENANHFFEQLSYEEEPLYTTGELQSFYQLQIKEVYLENAQLLDKEYEQLDFRNMVESNINGYRLSGAAADTYRKAQETFANRFDQVKNNGEYRDWFFLGKPYFMHSFLYRTIFIHLLIEAMILIVLASSLITNAEFSNRTQLVTFSTRRGRRLMADKFIASLFSSLLITTVLFLVTLGTFFTVFDYSHIWTTSINSGFNWEYKLPYVAWWDFSFATYFILAIIVSFVCMLLYSAFTFGLSVFLKNSYYTFILFAILFIGLFILPGFLPGSTNLKLWTGFNLSTLVLNPHQWWMGTSGFMMFQFFEIGTLIAWTVIFAVFCWISLKKFSKEDLS